MGISSAIRWIARARLGETTPRPQGRRRGSRLDGHADFIVGLIEQHKDITLNEMVERISTERSLSIGCSTLSDAFIIHRNPQRKPHPIQVGQIRRPDPRIGQAFLPEDNEPNFRFR